MTPSDGVIGHGRPAPPPRLTVLTTRDADLSPDGRLFVAFVAAHGRTPDIWRDTWVALSRPPWWRALALWFDGSTWSYGAFFADVDSCAGVWRARRPG